MAQIEKKVIAENHEKRENVRLDEYRPISVKDLGGGPKKLDNVLSSKSA